MLMLGTPDSGMCLRFVSWVSLEVNWLLGTYRCGERQPKVLLLKDAHHRVKYMKLAIVSFLRSTE